jgi:micrococcal nuclease
VVDGDTIKVRAFAAKRRFYTVRLIGIDTPETKRPGTPVECGGKRATDSMFELAFAAPQDTDRDGLLDSSGGSRGRRVMLRTDSSQDTFDRYGRLLAYVTTEGGVNLGVRQIARGSAAVYVYGGVPFRQVERFRAQRRARSDRRGVWARCRGDFHRPA